MWRRFIKYIFDDNNCDKGFFDGRESYLVIDGGLSDCM